MSGCLREVTEAGGIPTQAGIHVQPFACVDRQWMKFLGVQREERVAGLLKGKLQFRSRHARLEGGFDCSPECRSWYTRKTAEEVFEARAMAIQKAARQVMSRRLRHAGFRGDGDAFLCTHS